MIHPNSHRAYQELDLSKRQRRIIGAYKYLAGPVTDREILVHLTGLNWADMNKVRPRITELIALRLLEEKDKTTCAITGRTVRLVGLAAKQLELL